MKASKPTLLLCCDEMNSAVMISAAQFPCSACRRRRDWHITVSNTEGFSERACSECGYSLRLYWDHKVSGAFIKHFKALGVRQ